MLDLLELNPEDFRDFGGLLPAFIKENEPYFDHLRDFEHHPRKAFGSGLQGFYMGYRSLQKPHDIGRF